MCQHFLLLLRRRRENEREKIKCLFRAIVVWPFSFCSFACVANFDARRLWASGAPAANSLRTGLTVEFLRNNSSKHPFLQNYNSVATINLFIFIFFFFNSYFGAFVVQHIVYPFLFFIFPFPVRFIREGWPVSPFWIPIDAIDQRRQTAPGIQMRVILLNAKGHRRYFQNSARFFFFCAQCLWIFPKAVTRWLDDLLDVCPTAVSFFVTVDDEGLFFYFFYIFFFKLVFVQLRTSRISWQSRGVCCVWSGDISSTPERSPWFGCREQRKCCISL